MSNLRALLHQEILLATYDQGAATVETPLFSRFWANPKNLNADEAAYLIRPNLKTAAPFNKRNAPARQLGLQPKSKKVGAMFHVFNSFQMSPTVFQGLAEPESQVINDIAETELADQQSDFAKQHQTQKELAMAKFLANGVVYVDQATGLIVESSGATVESVDFGISATHQGTGNGLAVPFDDVHSDIEEMIENIRIQAETENSPPPTLAICNSTMKPYIRENLNFREFGAFNPQAQRTMLNGEWIDSMFGINWLFIDRTYVDSSGTTRKFIPDQKLILTSEASGWLQAVQGLELVPNTIDIQAGDMSSMARSFSKVYGKFSYGAMTHNPPALNVYMGDNYGWIVQEPNALWQLDVIFS